MNAITARGANPSTPHQRLFIRTLMQQLELSTFRYSLQHRIPFKAACLEEPPIDRDVDSHLRTLTFAQASNLINALRKQTGNDEGDNDGDE